MQYQLREFRPADDAAVNRLALAAYEQYSGAYSDWPALAGNIARMSSLTEIGELIVADAGDRLAGAVVYVGPGRPRSSFFQPEWSVVRMLAVDPAFRGHGIGRALVEECVRRARRDRVEAIALHTTPMMNVALAMYQRMGFEFSHDAPPLLGVPYGVYLKDLRSP